MGLETSSGSPLAIENIFWKLWNFSFEFPLNLGFVLKNLFGISYENMLEFATKFVWKFVFKLDILSNQS